MTPLVFGGRFGWLHNGFGKRGVVLCNAFGHEDVWSRNAMRRLAEALSARNVSVLRFDYRSTGDSVGVDGEFNLLGSALADIRAAVEQLKKRTGVTEVTLCGLRLGAAFATLAASECDLDGLVLLAPVTSGRMYLRELSAVHKTWLGKLAAPVRAAQPEAPFNVLGQVYSDEFHQGLKTLDLAKSLGNAPVTSPRRALVLETRPGINTAFADALSACGVDVSTETFDGYLEFMQETAFTVLPERAIETVAQWIAVDEASVPARADTDATIADEDRHRLVIETPEAIERPVLIGTAGVFGVLCEPRNKPTSGPVMLITNTSMSSHLGDSRLSVRIAREMARQGIASLRIDARGIGESAPLPPDVARRNPSGAIHANTTIEDVASAGAWLRKQGYDNVVSFGICSGAYSALRAALIEPAIAAVVTVNIQRFYMPEGISVKEIVDQQVNSMAGYASSMFEWNKWRRLFSGERSPLPIARAILSQGTARLRLKLGELRGSHDRSGPLQDMPMDPRSVVNALEHKGVRTLLIYGAFDSGLDQLTSHFGKNGKSLSRFTKVKAAVIADVDHSLFNPRASATVIALCQAFMKDLQPGASPAAAGKSPMFVSAHS
ncbi:alpha/beta hydrolase [Paraburkholderia sp. PREW-6R]|uniref:alpha/beta hydrolase n=1 Tax=Paraburkholderia sp. PREW-6R TaxID=3141544 RepID=UPI0031F5C33A